MLLLVALAASQAVQPPPPRVVLQATATVRIERPVTAGREQWDKAPPSNKHEIIVRDEQGRPMLLRIVENE
jgi:hypothetical protein